MKLSDLKISNRLALGFGALIVAMLVVAGLGTWLSHRQALLTHKTIDVDVQLAMNILSARAHTHELRRFEKDLLLSLPSRDRAAGIADKWSESRARLLDDLNAAALLAESPADRDALRELGASLAQYDRGMESLRTDVERGVLRTAAEGSRRIAQLDDAMRAVDAQADLLLMSAVRQVRAIKPALEATEARRRVMIAIGVVVVLSMALGIAVTIARSITRPVQYAVRVAEALAKGDLAQKVEVRSKDEIGRLMQALSGTVEQLAGIVGRIKDASDRVNAASREIAQANLDLSTRTEEQASALEETSASMQQMTATVGQNAQNARDASQLAAQAAGVAGRGGEMVRTAVGTMNGITDASRRIAEIIGVIDGIAFQTNILALNAAVEAARAGDQGRGFAVVAAEVRSLAQRSAGAAREIKALITDSVAKVDAGSRQVNDAGRTMEEIVSSVGQVSGLIAEIAKASEEQAQGIGQVSAAMTQLEHVTQQNAAMVEEASAAAGSLSEQAERMTGAVGAFRVDGNLALAPQAHRPPAAAPVARTPAPKARLRVLGKPAPAGEDWKAF